MDRPNSLKSLSRSSSTPLDLQELRESINELEHEEETLEDELNTPPADVEESGTDDSDSVMVHHRSDSAVSESGDSFESEQDNVEEAMESESDAQLMQMRLNFIRQVSLRGAASPDEMRDTTMEHAEDEEQGGEILDMLHKHDMIPTKVGKKRTCVKTVPIVMSQHLKTLPRNEQNKDVSLLIKRKNLMQVTTAEKIAY
eukprot:TRINITY_DN14212_c0_g1_i1.p1 TRINITY_DN14212_c0_g1~~TRINITY_DN14212_c0_g1_i1.p1  ORF type:complete len:199 (+),score=42.09 TRINITY_DN14212_c0_g1_i1:640-1236(+)